MDTSILVQWTKIMHNEKKNHNPEHSKVFSVKYVDVIIYTEVLRLHWLLHFLLCCLLFGLYKDYEGVDYPNGHSN